MAVRPTRPELVTIDSIVARHPCYHPSRHLPADYSSTLAQFIATQVQVPNYDRRWVAVQFLNARDLRLFACACARRCLDRITESERKQAAVNAITTAEQFAFGAATDAQRSAAESAARSAAWYAAWSAAESAAWSAAWSAARSAVWSAARSAARSAAESAVWPAAWPAEVDWQLSWLVDYLTDVYGG